jgi:hypothetical protein
LVCDAVIDAVAAMWLRDGQRPRSVSGAEDSRGEA